MCVITFGDRSRHFCFVWSGKKRQHQENRRVREKKKKTITPTSTLLCDAIKQLLSVRTFILCVGFALFLSSTFFLCCSFRLLHYLSLSHLLRFEHWMASLSGFFEIFIHLNFTTQGSSVLLLWLLFLVVK